MAIKWVHRDLKHAISYVCTYKAFSTNYLQYARTLNAMIVYLRVKGNNLTIFVVLESNPQSYTTISTVYTALCISALSQCLLWKIGRRSY